MSLLCGLNAVCSLDIALELCGSFVIVINGNLCGDNRTVARPTSGGEEEAVLDSSIHAVAGVHKLRSRGPPLCAGFAFTELTPVATPSACRAARDSGLWGPALLLARHAGDAAFQETAALMAQRTVNAGAPLRALLLLMAGAPDAVHAPVALQSQPGAV